MQDVELVIMGKGDERYEQFLREEVKRLGLKNVTFAGFVSGKAKYEQLASLSALFVPSEILLYYRECRPQNEATL